LKKRITLLVIGAVVMLLATGCLLDRKDDKDRVPAGHIDIQGSPEFINHIHVSLQLLAQKSPEGNALVRKRIMRITEHYDARRPGGHILMVSSRVQRYRLFFPRMASVPYTAAAIAHEAMHAEQCTAGRIFNGMTPAQRIGLETEAINFQIRVGGQVGVPAREIRYLQGQRGIHGGGDF
jgi:hypothetical protein